jgi:N-methylhydantoinase A
VHVSLSHEVVGTFREYERAATTEIDAALSPLLADYLAALADRARDTGLPVPDVMQSSGGLATLDEARAHAALTVLSGPAGGAAGAAWAALASGEPDALCFDMGGTSCDVCVIQGGTARETGGRPIGGRPVALPMLDLHTVGAGGGSIAWRDAGGALRVGPQSAGARPGPAAYGHGGSEPTVTDANVVLGLLGTQLAGGVALDAEAARAAVQRLADALGLSLLDTAEGIRRVANAEMVRALRVMTVERGVDPRALALLAFGGAGPLHATAIADELGMTTILCPRASGVLAALGLVVSERRRDAQRSVLLSGADLTAERLRAEIAALAGAGALRVTAELRYRGQAFELAVETGTRPDPDELREAFAAAHEQAYGYRDPDGEVELVTLRVTATEPGPEIDAAAAGATGRGAERSARRAIFDGAEHDATVLTGEPAPGVELAGPAIVELPEATLTVPPGWHGRVEASGTVRLER